jgi:hypothetical protein
VTTAVTVADALSGPDGFSLQAATSSERDAATDIQGWTLGAADTSGLLRAERAGWGGGRSYALRYEGRDLAGNSATCIATVTVPLAQGHT